MKHGRFRMVLLSLAMLVSIRRASTPHAQQDRRMSRYVTDGSSKHVRIRKELEARQAGGSTVRVFGPRDNAAAHTHLQPAPHTHHPTAVRSTALATQAAAAVNDDAASGSVRKTTKDGRKVIQGRLAVPEEIKQAMPKGYEKRLCSLDSDGQRKYTDVPVRWFSENYDDLLKVVRKHIPAQGFGSPPPVCFFRACLALQKWMIDKLEAERAAEDAE
jgi:hypothetical protein